MRNSRSWMAVTMAAVMMILVVSACGGGGTTPTPTYTATYNGNGNTGGNVPVDSTNYTQGQTITVLGNTGSLVNTGYSFAGWNTQANGSGTTYTQGQTFTMLAANVTLYAKWTVTPLTTTDANRAVFAGTSPAFVPWVDDPDIWDAFSFQVLSQPLQGTAAVASNKLVFTPNAGFTSGTDTFTYKATDQGGDSVTGTAAILVYDSAALSNCTQTSTVSSGTTGSLQTRTKSNPCTFYSTASTRVTDTGVPVTMDYFINWPSSGSAPKALVVLIGGGNLDMSLTGNTTTGVADTTGGGNFVVRSAQLFADAGYATVAIDRPSDQPSAGSTDDVADADQYRISVKHAVDILTVLKHINTENLDVFIAGTSRGAMSVVASNLIAAGVSLSSPVTSDTNITHLYVGKPGIANLQPSFVQRPAHVLWHQNDLCSFATPTNSQALYTSLSSITTASYDIASGGVRVTVASNNVTPDVCGAFDYHGYCGIEPTAVGYITNWLNARVTAFAGNKRPEAAFATVTTAAGVSTQTNLATLTRDQDGDSLSYALSHTTTSLGGSVVLNGSTVTYTPPAGVSNKTDYYVYVATDGKGGVGAAVITVLIGN